MCDNAPVNTFDDPFSTGAEEHLTCTECGADCAPEVLESDAGMRVAFVCPQHGVHSVVDPFSA